ncbi:MAG: DUF1343 domain-containing protein [Methyloligellaceae bacterium]
MNAERVVTGAQRLVREDFERLAGKRVGLIANHTTRVKEGHLADLLHASRRVALVALFGPEHGLRGTGDASEKIAHGRDEKTGVPVYSLYGDTRQPTADMLRGIDVLIFDIQDVGARFYTYISTMGLAMQVAAQAGIPFMVLDRPNPLGGVYMSGHLVTPENISFVSQYPIPLAHGMTAGELARMIGGEGFLPGLEKLRLEVVAMAGWRRDMLWSDTGLAWRPTSPNIPDFETALIYPGAGFFEATTASEGRGTGKPFRLIGTPWSDGGRLAETLNARRLPGVSFAPARFTPKRLPGMASDPKHRGKALDGVEITLTDPRLFQPVETGVHLLHAFREEAKAQGKRLIDRPDWLAKLAGTRRFHDLLRKGGEPQAVIADWRKDIAAFAQKRAPYLLYEPRR